jgi:hypothetical protein
MPIGLTHAIRIATAKVGFSAERIRRRAVLGSEIEELYRGGKGGESFD